MKRLLKTLIIVFLLFALYPLYIFIRIIIGSMFDTPFDPMFGPRNPVPGASSYLEKRADISPEQKICLLNCQPCDKDVLKLLSAAPSREVRSLVATNPSVTTDVLEKLSKDEDDGVRTSVAVGRNTPREILLTLLNDPDGTVRWSVPGNENLTESDIRELYNKKASLTMIAANNNTPVDILEQLAELSDSSISMEICRNRNITDKIALFLLNDSKIDVNYTPIGLVHNPAISDNILKILANNPRVEISNYANKYLEERKQSQTNKN
ncbi:HEAT repeat domain-containing protein [bacterium]|nr:MAG: HEAT repeat domain-containing protein [bacterium]